jgi:hypothetical protein
MMSGCGGSLISDWLGIFKDPSFTITSTPSVFVIDNYEASCAMRRSFILATIYYILVSPYNFPWNKELHNSLVSTSSARLLIVILQILNFLLLEFYKLDIYFYISEGIQRILLICPIITPQNYCITETNNGEMKKPSKNKSISNRVESKKPKIT